MVIAGTFRHMEDSGAADEPQASPPPVILLLPAPPPVLLLPAPAGAWANPLAVPRGPALVRELVETCLLAILVFLCVRASFGTYQVEGHSMDPTLQDGEFLIVGQLTYARVDTSGLSVLLPWLGDGKHHIFGGPGRGDIVILHNPDDRSGKRLVKRVIGLPGDAIETTNGVVKINGKPLTEPYIHTDWTASGLPVTCGPDSYYVMGDNRDQSSDSRRFGCVPHELIIGKAMITAWPRDRFGLAPNE